MDMKISDVERDYWRYCRVVHDDGELPVSVTVDVVDDLSDIFVHLALEKHVVVLPLPSVIVR